MWDFSVIYTFVIFEVWWRYFVLCGSLTAQSLHRILSIYVIYCLLWDMHFCQVALEKCMHSSLMPINQGARESSFGYKLHMWGSLRYSPVQQILVITFLRFIPAGMCSSHQFSFAYCCPVQVKYVYSKLTFRSSPCDRSKQHIHVRAW